MNILKINNLTLSISISTPSKGTKILCYMPTNLKKVKIPIKIQNVNSQGSHPSTHLNNNLSGQSTANGATKITSSSILPKSSTLKISEKTPNHPEENLSQPKKEVKTEPNS